MTIKMQVEAVKLIFKLLVFIIALLTFDSDNQRIKEDTQKITQECTDWATFATAYERATR